MRGTEKPQMSASSTPTVKPSPAMAAARLTVTELLPTPPLPDAMARTACGGGDLGVGRGLAGVPASLEHDLGALFARHLAPVDLHVAHTGVAATRVSTSFLIWPRSGQPPMVSLTVSCTIAVGRSTRTDGHHAEVDDVAAELGVDDAAEQSGDLLDGGRWRLVGTTDDSTGRRRVNSSRDACRDSPGSCRASIC